MDEKTLMKCSLWFTFFLMGLSLLGMVGAQVTYQGDTLRTQYAAGDLLSGRVNVTLNKTNLDSVISTNFAGTNMSLRAFLAANGFVVNEDYNCSTPTCAAGYVRKEPITSIGLSQGQALVGFSLQGGSISSIDNARATFDSASTPSCYLDLSLDVLNQSSHYLGSTRFIAESCYEPRFGCFEQNRNDYDSIVMEAGDPYCEKILLPVAPAFSLGARVTNLTEGVPGLKMRLYALDSTPLAECSIPWLNQSNQLVNCFVPYSSPVQREYFVCVEPTGSGSNYRIRVETHASCGTRDFGASYPGDYEVFAQNLKFDTPHIVLSGSSFQNATQTDLSDYLSTYIAEMYNGQCNPSCILPLRLFGADQQVSVSGVFLQYTSSLGHHTSDTLYRIERAGVTIDSGRLVLDLSKANFTIPLGANDRRLKVYIDNQEIVNKPVNISTSFSFGVTPLFVAFGQTTTFDVVLASNVTSVRWEFGDGSVVQTSSGKRMSYRYTQQGTFPLAVEVTRVDGVVSRRTFSVTVGNAHDAASTLLQQSQHDLSVISAAIASYPIWVQPELKTQLAYETFNQSLREASLLYERATNDSDYANVVTTVIGLNLPRAIRSEAKGTVPLIVGLESSSLDPLRTISGEETSSVSDEAIRRAVGSWMLENTHADISFDAIVADYEGETRPLATTFTIQTRPLSSFGEEVYLILGFSPNDLHFASSYTLQPARSFAAIKLASGNEMISFSVADSLRPEELGAYITPPLAQLGSFQEETYTCNFNAVCESGKGETWKTCSNDCRPWGLATTLIILLVFVGAIALGLILWWYKRTYESSLFPNRQDLFNILAFITASSRAGMDESDIRKKLKHAGWTGEQITFAFKKSKKKGNLGASSNDVKFIKRPEFKAS